MKKRVYSTVFLLVAVFMLEWAIVTSGLGIHTLIMTAILLIVLCFILPKLWEEKTNKPKDKEVLGGKG